jgi:hypothetical protein
MSDEYMASGLSFIPHSSFRIHHLIVACRASRARVSIAAFVETVCAFNSPSLAASARPVLSVERSIGSKACA